MQDKSIRVKGNVTGSYLISGDLQSSFNALTSEDLECLLKRLVKAVSDIQASLPPERVDELEEDLERFKSEVLKKKPSQKWYSLSAKGLIDAAKSVGEVGKPILELVSIISKTLGF